MSSDSDWASARLERRPDCAGLDRRTRLGNRYAVTVIAHDVGDAVQAAGGWIVDRVRAGWRVSALVPAGSDVTPMRILGVSTTCFGTELNPALLAPLPATLAMGSAVSALPNSLADQVRALVQDQGTEITIWGGGQVETSRRFDEVQHRLSPAARAFKFHALRGAALPPITGRTEIFRTCAPWYRLDDGVDLERVPAAAQHAEAP